MSGEREVGGGSSGSLIGGGERVAVTSEGSKEGPRKEWRNKPMIC